MQHSCRSLPPFESCYLGLNRAVQGSKKRRRPTSGGSLALALSAFAADDAIMLDKMASNKKMECTGASMSKMKTDVIGMASGEKKDMAMKEIQMADDMMKDMEGCAGRRNALA